MYSKWTTHYDVALLAAWSLLLAGAVGSAADLKADNSARFTLPGRIDIGSSNLSIRLEFKGRERTLSTLLHSADGKVAPVNEQSTNYHLQLVCLGDDAQGLLIGRSFIWWGEHGCSMAQLPIDIRKEVHNFIALNSPRKCGDFIHAEVPLNGLLMAADGQPVANAKELWDQAKKQDARFATVNFPRQRQVLPKGWVAQPLEPTGGSVHRPTDWHFSSKPDPNALKWFITKEDFSKGPYETGVSVQMFLGVEKMTNKSPRQYATDFLAGKQSEAKKVHHFCERGRGDSDFACLEVEEGNYWIHYQVSWATGMDVLWVITSGAPERLWEQYKETLLAVTDGVKLLDAGVVRQILSRSNQTNQPAKR